ncbi:MAG TPA: nucleotide sugar dehydrogenase [Syntrophales bacterium]|nr:nucleotide sugar dehydrogenase [Syntrophales bacterium]HOM07730.1 nucleotide sugar dehydrogenase [Syntrophales bacterium]HOO00393.1 nucleotide sugar dehydrogenase [Syntrophales bacterium]HPQ07253.1 nucleotide sugar dehydrogenase [Syntrophales bacterium]HRV43169.1 nucleotide sugar dehydrogenase [Syntrophales bacterium]
MNKKNILCIGAGYVGGPTMAVIAKKCPDYRVTVVDINPERISAWNSSRLPIYEPGLDEIVAETRGKNLFFSTDIEGAIRDNDIIFVSVNTPTKAFGIGAGMAADLRYWEKTARQILENARSPKIVIEKSTLPVKTALAMERILASAEGGVEFEVLSNPEFLAEGSAIRDLEYPDRVLIGSRDTDRGRRARDTLVEIYSRWVPREKIITTNIWSSELSKLVANAFLAQRVSSINAVSALCEKTEADVTEVARAVGLDSRIGGRFLNASVGFGGSCFKKDILNLVYLCRFYGLDEVADYWERVVKINVYQQERFIEKMLSAMFNTLAGKRICLFGFAFKADTGDTRESPAIYIAKRLLEEQAEVVVTDPRALENARADLAGVGGSVQFVEDPYEAAVGAHAVCVMTEWDLYRRLDYGRIWEEMVKPAFLFDGRNILDHRRCFEMGFNVYAIGKPPLTHF